MNENFCEELKKELVRQAVKSQAIQCMILVQIVNLGKDFNLYNNQDVIDSKLFGTGKPNELFEDALGDFIAIAYESNKCLITDGDKVLLSQYSGYSDDEIYIPLIIIDNTK